MGLLFPLSTDISATSHTPAADLSKKICIDRRCEQETWKIVVGNELVELFYIHYNIRYALQNPGVNAVALLSAYQSHCPRRYNK